MIYKVEPPFQTLGFRDANGLSSYYSANITKAEATTIKEFQEECHISPLNTRLIKLADKYFWLRIASAQKGGLPYLGLHKWRDLQILVENGEFACFMKRTAECLKRSAAYAGRATQQQMMDRYVEHFMNGE